MFHFKPLFILLTVLLLISCKTEPVGKEGKEIHVFGVGISESKSHSLASSKAYADAVHQLSLQKEGILFEIKNGQVKLLQQKVNAQLQSIHTEFETRARKGKRHQSIKILSNKTHVVAGDIQTFNRSLKVNAQHNWVKKLIASVVNNSITATGKLYFTNISPSSKNFFLNPELNLEGIIVLN